MKKCRITRWWQVSDVQWIHILWKVVQHLNWVQTIPFFIWTKLPTNVISHKPILHPQRMDIECYLAWKAKTQSWEVSESRFVTISLPSCECVCSVFKCTISYWFSQWSQTFENSQWMAKIKAQLLKIHCYNKGKMKRFWPKKQTW